MSNYRYEGYLPIPCPGPADNCPFTPTKSSCGRIRVYWNHGYAECDKCETIFDSEEVIKILSEAYRELQKQQDPPDKCKATGEPE